ncbi:thermonuclease family protein [Sphingorhabdus pulchriflava]|uniref:Thermonuclease family protein n=1 Tax=Sphingorhabdus pulchriflava TaxID=2292257 RepID=A0A371BJ55_9SPHN|nr:thermonuclease family protein [Sphingorhabdus pulchriflava]RDV07620.1 thermonuclease family protein [Sphingorhabdus pulchriflava]
MITLKFPDGRVYRKRGYRIVRGLFFLLMLGAILAAWYYADGIVSRETIIAARSPMQTADGDSFAIGPRKFRLKGIDAPEYRQTCNDAKGMKWECGKAARAALEKLLLEPGLTCVTDAQDRYHRALATCKTTQTPDLGAKQVTDGFAVSHEYYGLRDYGSEEDAASSARRGIWQGNFIQPDLWRATQTR